MKNSTKIICVFALAILVGALAGVYFPGEGDKPIPEDKLVVVETAKPTKSAEVKKTSGPAKFSVSGIKVAVQSN